MSETTTDAGLASRRVVLAGAAGVCAAAALAACGSSSDSGSSTPTGGHVMAKKSDIPEGGGKIFEKEQVVITQPTAGTFKAFTALCTHQACTVTSVSGGTINCPCHGSKYSVTDGSVKEAANGDKNNSSGQKGLAEKTLQVDGDNLSVG
jgi:nitrite reductase/ring-hydroxylating ferredoxin subunit